VNVDWVSIFDPAIPTVIGKSESALNATVSAPNATVEHAPSMKAPFMGLTLQTR